MQTQITKEQIRDIPLTVDDGSSTAYPVDRIIFSGAFIYDIGSGDVVVTVSGGGGGVTDHGALTGLADDDHLQYHTDARGDARYAPLANGVTNGDTHDHVGGDGAQIDHGGLAGLSDDDHSQYHTDTRGDARYLLRTSTITSLAPTTTNVSFAATHGTFNVVEISLSGIVSSTKDLLLSCTGANTIGTIIAVVVTSDAPTTGYTCAVKPNTGFTIHGSTNQWNNNLRYNKQLVLLEFTTATNMEVIGSCGFQEGNLAMTSDGTMSFSSSPQNNFSLGTSDNITALITSVNVELTGFTDVRLPTRSLITIRSNSAISSNNLILKHNSGSSTVPFLLPNGQDFVIAPGDAVVLQYLASGGGFVVVGSSSAGTLQGVNIDPSLPAAATTNDILVYDGSKITFVAPSRETLTANRTYYVRTDGSDSNTGLANTAGGAFLTIQKAVDVTSTLDIKTYDVTIQVADGTYVSNLVTLKNPVGSGSVIIQGNSGTPANVVIDGGFYKGSVGTSYTVKDMKLIKSSATGVSNAIDAAYGALISYGNINFGAGFSIHVASSSNSIVARQSGCTISGSASAHWLANTGGILQVGGGTITLTGTPAFTWFVYGTRAAAVACDGTTFSGSATGARYLLDTNAVIFTSGGGANYLPGNSAGSASSGGQYA